MKAAARLPKFEVGEYVASLGENPQHGLWLGHPGRIIEVEHPTALTDVSVTFVAGPILSVGREGIEPIEFIEYRRRGERVIGGLHPLEERQISTELYGSVDPLWP